MSNSSTNGGGGLEDLAEPDYDHLSFSYFDDDDDDDLYNPKKQKDHKKKPPSPPSDPPFILGTLIVRVVAARDLPAAQNVRGGGGLGDFFFGGGGNRGSANPLAICKFGATTQQTSAVSDTLNPVWPRGETMFMDVSLPSSTTTHAGDLTTTMTTTSTALADTTSSSSGGTTPSGSPPPPPPPPQHVIDSPLSSSLSSSPKNHLDNVESLGTPQPILTVAIFSASHMGSKNKKSVYDGKNKHKSGDSDDEFLGLASLDLTSLLTGKIPQVDTWLPLQGTPGAVRVTCEYEAADVAPGPGDLVALSKFCHPADLYPLVPGQIYPVHEIVDQDHVLLSYTSPEGWFCSFMVHRYMILCIERRYGHGAVEACRDELQSITHRLQHSPLVGTVTNTVQRLPEEGIVSVGMTIFQGGASLLGRWVEEGLDTAVEDVAFATNWDGRFNPNALGGRPPMIGNGDTSAEENNNDNSTSESPEAGTPPSPVITSLEETTTTTCRTTTENEPLPNMPSCPITGEPMLDPVVAADGHTYERAAIARWLQTSDKSPLTGSILPHKELVPNYGLLSSLQEQADSTRKASSRKKPPPPVAAASSEAEAVAAAAAAEAAASEAVEEEEAALAEAANDAATTVLEEEDTAAPTHSPSLPAEEEATPPTPSEDEHTAPTPTLTSEEETATPTPAPASEENVVLPTHAQASTSPEESIGTAAAADHDDNNGDSNDPEVTSESQ